MRDRGRLLGIIWSMHCVVGEFWWWNEDKEELEARKPQVEVSRFCLRAGVTGVLWFYGRNMIMARVRSVEFNKMGHSSQVRGKSACADRHCSQSKWPSARIADIDNRYSMPHFQSAPFFCSRAFLSFSFFQCSCLFYELNADFTLSYPGSSFHFSL